MARTLPTLEALLPMSLQRTRTPWLLVLSPTCGTTTSCLCSCQSTTHYPHHPWTTLRNGATSAKLSGSLPPVLDVPLNSVLQEPSSLLLPPVGSPSATMEDLVSSPQTLKNASF